MWSADMPSQFWAMWIGIITLVSIVGLIWMLISVYFVSEKDEQHALPVWDEDLREGTRKPPIWWFWMLLALLVFSDIYLILYPGLGRFEGALRWSQAGRLMLAEKSYQDNFAGIRNLVVSAPYETMQSDPELMAAAERVYAQNCAACHGPTGRGQAQRFPNLRDSHWQWGGSAEQIEQSIRLGRQGVMPGWQAVLGDQGVKEVADYVRQLASTNGPAEDHPGKARYAQVCVACHGPTGTGNPALGAPDLTAGVYVRGGKPAELQQTISEGAGGVMPAFGNRLDDLQMRLLVAWLSQQK